MLSAVNPQAVVFAGNQFQGQTEQANVVTSNSEHEDKVTNNQQVRTLPGQEETGPDGRKRDTFELSKEAEEIRQLQTRDQEVRTHEAAHAAAGGSYAGSPSFTYERGPDGRSYAVGGEVSIDVSPIPGDPEATLQKAQQVRAAALAPSEPSAQDMKVAQRAQAMAADARMEIAEDRYEQVEDGGSQVDEVAGGAESVAGDPVKSDGNHPEPSLSKHNNSPGVARLSVHA